MDPLFHFPAASEADRDVAQWFAAPVPLRAGQPRTASRWPANDLCGRRCLRVYLNAYAAHGAIGFFFAAELPDPASLIEGTGKRMHQVKLKPGRMPDEAVTAALIAAANRDIRQRLSA